MNEPKQSALFECAPAAAIAAVQAHVGPILVDLDETLYLLNTTEDFIDSAKPGVLALILMRGLDILKPWRFTGGETTRDAWRVRAIAWCSLEPATLIRIRNLRNRRSPAALPDTPCRRPVYRTQRQIERAVLTR